MKAFDKDYMESVIPKEFFEGTKDWDPAKIKNAMYANDIFNEFNRMVNGFKRMASKSKDVHALEKYIRESVMFEVKQFAEELKYYNSIVKKSDNEKMKQVSESDMSMIPKDELEDFAEAMTNVIAKLDNLPEDKIEENGIAIEDVLKKQLDKDFANALCNMLGRMEKVTPRMAAEKLKSPLDESHRKEGTEHRAALDYATQLLNEAARKLGGKKDE